jgi:P27 family predicted phage terminase small subunit
VLKLIRGNPGRRPLNPKEATPPVQIPEPPTLLKDEALREWNRVTPLLADVGLISKLDRAVIASYCQTWARWIDCERMLESTGLIVESPNGYPMYSPYLAQANRAIDQMRRLSEQMGLTGSSRSRIKAGDPASGGDAAEKFLSGPRSA